VGGQWRFTQEGISSLIGGPSSAKVEPPPVPTDILPLHWVQPIQQVFAEIAQVGSLTDISNSCTFCNLILESEPNL
jgi:hypothetical protein